LSLIFDSLNFSIFFFLNLIERLTCDRLIKIIFYLKIKYKNKKRKLIDYNDIELVNKQKIIEQ
jgi:hypothetical protein